MRKTLCLMLFAFCLTTAVHAQSQTVTVTECDTVTDCDNLKYPTVRLGNVCWMSKNLATESCVALGNVYAYESILHTDVAANVAANGLLYDAIAVMQDSSVDANGHVQGICPDGWYLPTVAYFEQLKAKYSADDLRSATGWINVVGNNSTGFSWNASGIYNGNTSRFEELLSGGYLWAVEMVSGTPVLTIYEMPCHCDYFFRLDNPVNICASVRCVKEVDNPTPAPEPETFSCGTSQMIDSSGNHYETVLIGTQCWTKTNLRTTKFRNGNPIPEDIDPDQFSSASFSRISPDYTQTYPDSTFGFYYNWYAAADTGNSKLCPDGWHVPNDGDWMVLSSYLRGNYACGNNLSYNAKAMADSLLWGDYNEDCSVGKDQESNNASGFSAVPAGFLAYDENLPIYKYDVAYFWIAMPSESDYAKYYVVSRYLAELKNYDNPKSYLLSVRCIKDDTTTIVRPVVTTDSATAVTTMSAKLHGTIFNPNGIVIVKKGFEWKLSSKNYYDIKDVTGTELVTTLGNLIPDTQYTFRAFINYDGKTYYGDELTFKTPIKPTVTTGNATNIALTSATISGTISNPDQVTLTAKGFLWKKSHGVYEYDTVKLTGGNAMTHTFSDLTPNTKYDYKAFVKYDNKTVYGEEFSFTTPNHPEVSCGTMTDADGNLYQTVKVGSQCWTKTNLRTTKYRNGSTISNQIGTTVPAYYRLSDTDKSTDSIVKLATAPDSIFGFYYNGYAAVRDSLCPVGWHVPDTNDWKDLIGYLKARPEYWCDNDNSNLAKAVASRNFWFNVETPPITYTINHDPVARPCSPQYQGPDYLNDASYFSAIPAGAWYDNLGGNIDTVSGFGGREFDPGKDAHFWSSSPQLNSDSTGYFFRLGIVTYDVVALAYDALKYGRSVRCLRDEPATNSMGANSVTKPSDTLLGMMTTSDDEPIATQDFEWQESYVSMMFKLCGTIRTSRNASIITGSPSMFTTPGAGRSTVMVFACTSVR